MEVLVKAWTEDILEYNGKLIQIPPRRVVPKSIQKLHPPLWMACVAPDSYEIAGDRGLGVLSFAMNWDFVQQIMREYKKAGARRTHPISKVITEQFAGLIIVHVCEKKEEEQIGLDGARWFMSHVSDLFRPLMSKNNLYSYEYIRQLFGLLREPAELPDAELKAHPMVVGTPDEVISKLEVVQKAGVDQVICFKQAGRIPHRNIMLSLQRMGKYIFPHFNPHRTTAIDEPLFSDTRRW